MLKYKHGNGFHEYGIQQNEEPYKFVLNFSQRLDLKSLNKDVSLQNLSIYYTWKNKRKQYTKNKLKIITPTWNDEFELSDGSYSVSDTKDCIEYIIKKYKTSKKLSLECFLLEFPYFFSFTTMNIFLVYNSNTEQSL